MAIVLALGAAAFYGSSDFIGALASRRVAVLSVATGAQIAGLLTVAVALPFLGPAIVTRTDLAAGGAAGIFGALGLIAVYRCLARGPMSIVAPTTALSASAVPILVGLVRGERPGAAALAGIAIAFVAVTLITRESPAPGTRSPRFSATVLGPAIGAGAILGFFFVCLGAASADAGLWPLLAARLVSVPILVALVASRRPAAVRDARLLVTILVCGILDMAANVLFLLASHRGMLAIVAAITGLYPASTILLAQTRLDERMAPIQFTGLGIGAIAAVLVALP